MAAEPILRLTPSVSVLVFIGSLVAFGPVLFVVGITLGVGQLYGLIILIGTATVWLSVATIRIELDDERLRKTIFWHSQWCIDLSQAQVREGAGGDVPFIPALVVSSTLTGRRVGEILIPQFRPSEIQLLKDALIAKGVMTGSQ